MPSEFESAVTDLRHQLKHARLTIDELHEIVGAFDGSQKQRDRSAAMVQIIDAHLTAAQAHLMLLATS